MALTIELTPDIENRLSAEAAKRGQQPTEFVAQLLERELKPKEFDLKAFSALSREQQDQILRAAAENAAPLYNADLERPVAERELTAFTALDGDDFVEYE